MYALGDNPLFADAGLSKVQCGWPAWEPDLPAQRAYYAAVFACLDRVWAPLMAARNLPFAPVKFAVFDQPYKTTNCGGKVAQPDEISFECEGVIYMPSRYFTDVEHILPASFDVFVENAAHEYGHYIQYLSGVSGAYDDARSDAGERSAQGLLLSRRLELQAQCFSGMFFAAALGPQDFHDAKVDAYLRGDYESHPGGPDHGTPERSGAWFTQGGEKNRTAQCNTWDVPPGAVE